MIIRVLRQRIQSRTMPKRATKIYSWRNAVQNYNARLFQKQYDRMSMIIDSLIFDEGEKRKRFDVIYETYNEIERTGDIDQFLQHAHELESYAFLGANQKAQLALDSRNQKGPDITYNNEIYFECVACTPGKDRQSELFDNFLRNPCGYTQKQVDNYLNPRITQALCTKAKRYQEYIDDGMCGKKACVNPNYAFVIFLSYGSILSFVPDDENGMHLTEVLLGRGNPQIAYNKGTGEVMPNGYAHRHHFCKINKEDKEIEIDCNFFLEFSKNVAGVLLATQQMDYNSDNVVLFINPYSDKRAILQNLPVHRKWDMITSTEYGIIKNS